MKRPFFFILLSVIFITFAACSCNPVNNDPEENGENTQPEDKPDDGTDDGSLKPGTFKFVASSLKGRWNAGDKIYVHGQMGSWSEVITLSSGDISSDGKTATAQLGDVTLSPAEPDLLYAAWPDEAVKHVNKKLGSKTSFASCNQPLTVAYLKDDTFTFIDASSALIFTVNGEYDSYALAANNRDGLVITNLEIDHTSQHTTFEPKENNGYPFLYGSVQPGERIQLWMPGDFKFKNGITIFLGKGDNWSATYKITNDLVLHNTEYKDLGDITSFLEPYNGPAPRMPVVKDKSTRFSVKFNELSGICLSEDESFLWSVGDNGDLARLSFTGEVLSTFHIGGDAEDVSRNPDTGDLLIGLEPNGAGLVKGPDFNTRVTTLFTIAACNNYDNSGVEGLAYYKNGKIFVGAQHNSHLFFCDLETKKVEWDLMLWNENLISEIGGLCYDPVTDWLWVIDSEAKKVFVLSAEVLVSADKSRPVEDIINNALLGAYPVPESSNPESVCVDHKNSCIWVGDDYGDTSYLYRYDMSGLDD